MAKKLKREREKRAAIRAAKEAQRRAAQSSKDINRRKITTVQDIITGYVSDVLHMIKYKVDIGAHINMRLKQAEALKEVFPAKFSQLRIDELKKAKESFEVVSKQIDNMAEQLGMLEDLNTFQEKMKFVSEHAGEAAMAQADFDIFGSQLRAIDQRYVDSFAKIQKGENLLDTLEEAGVDFEQESEKLTKEMKEDSHLTEEVSSDEQAETVVEEIKEKEEPSTGDVFMEVPVSDEEAKQIIIESKSEE